MSNIEGVQVVQLSQILDYRGSVMKMLSNNDPNFSAFGEIYFSTVHPEIVKGWHLHRDMELNYACVYGKILLVLIDERPESPTDGNQMEIYLSPQDYKLVKVPPGVLNAFKGLGTTDSIIANCATLPYNEKEIMRFSLDFVDYNWFRPGG